MVARTASSGSASAITSGSLAAICHVLPAKSARLCAPSLLSPSRKMARTTFCIERISFITVRCATSKRQRRHGRLLTCTCRNQPVRMICAKARAIITIGLVRHHRALSLARLNRMQADPHPAIRHETKQSASTLQARCGPLAGRHRPASDQRLRLAGAPHLFHDPARVMDDTNHCFFQRHVQSGIVRHSCFLSMLVADQHGPRSNILKGAAPRRGPQSSHLFENAIDGLCIVAAVIFWL